MMQIVNRSLTQKEILKTKKILNFKVMKPQFNYQEFQIQTSTKRNYN